ncbi:hypothetical protein PZ895_07995 [Mesorhizobium sp. YIM 152430]|uniref:hypothetical protein n=1 Tax=Mesorhizobium sp. YIM 152430 TaxID=3031761 RepID=UPI0023DCC2E8|nr:hypothetical protein [Mesorhizobium sp. YIM 152430]MDF1599717.1 hypothetical protein [Mesorhizobium sp. YIM 152430]
MTKITNNAAGVRVVNAKVDGKVTQVSLRPGETKDLDLIETKAMKARIGSGDIVVGKSAAKAKESDTGFKAEHHGGGKFNVTEGETVHLSGLSKADADAFNAMSPADQKAYVDAEKAK